MTTKSWAILLIAITLTVGAYQVHARSVGRLEGEIKARGEAIKQLSQLAAEKRRAYQQAKAAFAKAPSLESCSVVLLTCEDRHATDSTQIDLLDRQVAALKKLSRKDKLFGILPRPTVQIGYCVMANLKFAPCISGGFPILK